MSTAAVLVALAAPFAGVPVPAVDVDSYRVRVDSSFGPPEVRTLRAPEDARVRVLQAGFPLIVSRRGTDWLGASGATSGSVLRNGFAARPDGFPAGTDQYFDVIESALAESRAGTRTFTQATLAGKTVLRTEVAVTANDCAGLPARTVRLSLAPRTLLPRRVVERAQGNGAVLATTAYAYTLLNATLPGATFTPPPLGRRPERRNLRFTRATPVASAGPLPYTPKLPAVVPAGFTLAVAGWAPRSGFTGPEGSIPPSPWLFGAVYRKGQERIDITQRVASTDWPDSPFGGECQPLATEPVTIGTASGTFGIGPTIVPHVFWRDGPFRYTVSGPFPKDDLVAIAASLQKVTP